MDRQKSLNRFEFDDHAATYQKVQSQTGIKMNAVVNDPETDLPFKRHTCLVQFMGQTNLIYRLKQSGAEARMNAERTIHHDRSRPLCLAGNRLP